MSKYIEIGSALAGKYKPGEKIEATTTSLYSELSSA